MLNSKKEGAARSNDLRLPSLLDGMVVPVRNDRLPFRDDGRMLATPRTRAREQAPADNPVP